MWIEVSGIEYQAANGAGHVVGGLGSNQIRTNGGRQTDKTSFVLVESSWNCDQTGWPIGRKE